LKTTTFIPGSLVVSSQFTYLPPEEVGIEWVYQDEHLLITNKPAGLLSVPGRGADKSDCLTVRVQNVFSDALSVHRLDMSTSGLMVFARGAEMHRQLSQLFRERRVQKSYIAMVSGKPKQTSGEITLPLSADWPNRPRQKVDVDNGKPSLTRYRVINYDAATDVAHVKLEPVTGRTHQLRIHLATIGHPILGDTLYEGRSAERLMLHANMLSFVHPVYATPLRLASEVPF